MIEILTTKQQQQRIARGIKRDRRLLLFVFILIYPLINENCAWAKVIARFYMMTDKSAIFHYLYNT